MFHTKNIKQYLIVSSILPLMAVLLSFISNSEEDAQRYDTESCTIYYNGEYKIGSWCNVPDSDGPCSRKSDCTFWPS